MWHSAASRNVNAIDASLATHGGSPGLQAGESFLRIGLQPWPGAFTSFRAKQLQITQAKVGDALLMQPGGIRVLQDRLLAGCGNGTVLEILEVQPEGKKRISAREFVNGYRPKDGEKLGETVSSF